MKYNNHLYWIGVRESEIRDTNDLFNGSITTYGSNLEGNYAFDKTFNYRYDCNTDNQKWIDFINEKGKLIINRDNDAHFMLYYSPEYSELDKEIKKRVICKNSDTIIDFLDNKITSRIWLSEIVNTVPFIILMKNKITYKNLTSKFPKSSSFVLQGCESSGGSKTIYIDKKSIGNIVKYLSNDESYSISPYVDKNISINVHIIIYEEEIVFFPPSIQIIQNSDNHLSYMGNDFLSYNILDQTIQNKIYQSSLKIGENLKKIGYLGVCGIDFISTKDDVIFMEINPRFQASTVLLNKQLINMNEKLSVQKLQIDAFNHHECSYNLSNFKIKYSIYFYKYKKYFIEKLKCCHELYCNNTENIYCYDDNINWNYKFDENAYLFSLIVNQNITSINVENNLVLDQNIDIYNSEIININRINNCLIELKIMLLNQGVRLSPKAEEYITNNGGLNYEEFQAIDMKIFDKYFNVPIFTRLTCISPFEIDVENDNNVLVLKYYRYLVGEIEIRKKILIGDINITDKIKASDITYMSNDRLRIFHRNGCYYKEKDIGCKFCDVENKKNDFTIDIIKSAIELYSQCDNINHYLIGGGSDDPTSTFDSIFEIVKYLRGKTQKKISIMTTPPNENRIIKKLKEYGVNEVIYNIEIFDRNLAKKFMPGKGSIPLTRYTQALKKSIDIFGKGNVRSMLILGLESRESFLNGIEYLSDLGVYPTISLFKPINNTPLSCYLPPSNKDILFLYKEAQNICKKHNVSLGPNCRYCEDNTIKISD